MTTPNPVQACPYPVKRILIMAPAPAQLLDVAGPSEVFAQASRFSSRSKNVQGNFGAFQKRYEIEVAIFPDAASRHTTTSGVGLVTGPSLADLLADRRPLDTLILAGGEGARLRAGESGLNEGVRMLAERARRIASVCTGAFILAAAGLLDHRRATTHWRWCERLARDYPRVNVEAEPIYTRDGKYWTSAGVTAGMDLALALVEDDHGHQLALAIARELVMFLRRPGGQAQFSLTLSAQTARDSRLRDLVAWIVENLHQPLSVEILAARVGLSPRQFARVFAQEVGITPALMVDRARTEAAKRLLEEAHEGLTAVSESCGFGSEETMRRAFLRHLGVPPGAYRDRFRRPSRH